MIRVKKLVLLTRLTDVPRVYAESALRTMSRVTVALSP